MSDMIKVDGISIQQFPASPTEDAERVCIGGPHYCIRIRLARSENGSAAWWHANERRRVFTHAGCIRNPNAINAVG